MASTRGRSVVIPMTNKSGGSVAAGDVVVIDTSNDTSFTTTTTGRAEVSLGVAQETIGNNSTGRVLVSGYASLINVPASVTRGHYIETHTVAKQATGNSSRRSGSFGQFFTGGTTPTGWLWGISDQTASGGSAGALVLLETQTASTSAQLDFTTFISSTYDEYIIEGIGLRPATDGTDLRMRVGTGGGPTYDTGSVYFGVLRGGAGSSGGTTSSNQQDAGSTSIMVAKVIDNDSGFGHANFFLRLCNPQSTSLMRGIYGNAQWHNGTEVYTAQIGYLYGATPGTALTAVRFFMASGNITSGVIRAYGIAK